MKSAGGLSSVHSGIFMEMSFPLAYPQSLVPPKISLYFEKKTKKSKGVRGKENGGTISRHFLMNTNGDEYDTDKEKRDREVERGEEGEEIGRERKKSKRLLLTLRNLLNLSSSLLLSRSERDLVIDRGKEAFTSIFLPELLVFFEVEHFFEFFASLVRVGIEGLRSEGKREMGREEKKRDGEGREERERERNG